MSSVAAHPAARGRASEEILAVAFDALGLGDRTYLIHDGSVAIVVDPQRDPDPYLERAALSGVRIAYVLETHVHNDYVSGGPALARRTGATYGVPRGETVASAPECLAIGDGEELAVGRMRIRALATPGHTTHHLAYVVEAAVESQSSGRFVCTGGSLLAGGTGRTDLLGEELAGELAEAQWSSVRRLLETLPEATVVLSTHGFGSFCSASPTAPDLGNSVVTIGMERRRNPAATHDRAVFVRSITADPPPIPAYYRFMGAINRMGAPEIRRGPIAVTGSTGLDRVVDRGGYVVDLRSRRDYAARHRIGTLNIELGANLATYFGWIVPYEAPFTVVADTSEELEEARSLLARIGREELSGWVPAADVLLGSGPVFGSYPVATFEELAAARRSAPLEVVDVRHRSEWREGHLRGARHVALPDLTVELASLAEGLPLWVHCTAGFRAAIAASILHGAGRSPVLVDDSFDHAAAAGLEIESGDAPVAPVAGPRPRR